MTTNHSSKTKNRHVAALSSKSVRELKGNNGSEIYLATTADVSWKNHGVYRNRSRNRNQNQNRRVLNYKKEFIQLQREKYCKIARF